MLRRDDDFARLAKRVECLTPIANALVLVNLVSFPLRQALADDGKLVLRVARPVIDQVKPIDSLTVEADLNIGGFPS